MTLPVKNSYVTCEYGRPGSWAAGKHTGIDYHADVGTSIYATRGGVVEQVGWGSLGSAYGFYVLVRSRTRLGNSRKHLYAHLSSSPHHVGKVVGMGDFLGKSGNTGNTTGPHLHYEERVYPYGYWNFTRPVFPYYRDLVSVRLSKLKPGKRSLSVGIVRRRLRKKHIKEVGRGFKFDKKFRDGYARWQKRLGYKGTAANGIPGETSLRKLRLRVKP